MQLPSMNDGLLSMTSAAVFVLLLPIGLLSEQRFKCRIKAITLLHRDERISRSLHSFENSRVKGFHDIGLLLSCNFDKDGVLIDPACSI